MTWMILAALFVISVWMLSSGISGQTRKQEYNNQIERNYGKAVAYYVVDRGLSVHKAQKRVKMDVIEREMERNTFRARDYCPACEAYDVHWLRSRKRYSNGVTRICRECNHEWVQL